MALCRATSTNSLHRAKSSWSYVRHPGGISSRASKRSTNALLFWFAAIACCNCGPANRRALSVTRPTRASSLRLLNESSLNGTFSNLGCNEAPPWSENTSLCPLRCRKACGFSLIWLQSPAGRGDQPFERLNQKRSLLRKGWTHGGQELMSQICRAKRSALEATPGNSIGCCGRE